MNLNIFWLISIVCLVEHLSEAYQCFELKNLNTDHCDQCDHGSRCILTNDQTNNRNRNVTCQCIDVCHSFGDSVDSRQICGSDGNVYDSICHLNKHSCESKKEITIKYIGQCDPCKGVNCLPNQTCFVDSINRQPICQCDDNCDQMPFEPVCSTDGKTYFNECSLKVQACKQRRDLKILSKGECKDQKNDKLCDEANCANYELCDLDLNGRASCVCQLDCPPIYSPVCSSLGLTYDSICELKKNACIQKQEILILHYGVCGQQQQSQCDNYQCNFGSFCAINTTTSETYCECEKECENSFNQICGSDGLTYLNHCFLKRASCIQQKEIYQLYEGACTGCMLHKCEKPHSTCKINTDQQFNNQTVECLCIFDCEQINNGSKQICAEDPKSGLKQIFSNECELKKRSCETNTEMTVLSDLSICELCKQVFCKYGAICYLGKCICPNMCPKDLIEPVCSNLGITFPNECELRRAACLNSKDPKTGNLNYDKLDNYTILFYGDCNKHQEIANEDLKLIPVLGKSSILLSNQMIGGYMTICNENTCKFGGKCYYNENGSPACLCSFDCSPLKNENHLKVCGQDGRLYLNDCKLHEEACIRQQKIDTQPLKNCLMNRNLFVCNGTLPQFDRSSGKFLDCNKKSIFYRECSFGYTCLYHRKVLPSIKTLLTTKDQDHFCCNQDIDQIQHNSLNELLDIKFNEQQQIKCDCNKLGSELPIRCNISTGQCECKKGITGLKCNQCMTGYYGFNKLSQGNDGCLKCECNKNGSLREDCEQTSGLCICKNGVTGIKCDLCLNGKKLTSFGCIDDALMKVHKKNCSSIKCRFGSVCKEISSNRSQCVCNYSCRKRFEINYQRKRLERDDSVSYPNDYYDDFVNYSSFVKQRESRDKSKYLTRLVCDSDGLTHLNECEMRIYGCRMQKKIVKVKDGQCQSTKELINDNFDKSSIYTSILTSPVTQTSVRRSTLEKIGDLYNVIDERTSISQFATESSLSTNLYTNLYDEERSNFEPMFNGRSFIRIQSRLESNFYLKLEIELIAFSERGIIFYNGQSNKGIGDFISLTLNNGFFEFRFNLGSGISTLRSKERVVRYLPVKVTLIKNFKKGILIVNDQDEVSCVADGDWKSLDLNENFFLGYVKTNHEKIYENLNNVRTGFVGCLMKLELGRNDRDLENVELLSQTNKNIHLNDGATTVDLFDHGIAKNKINQKHSKMKILESESIGNCSKILENKINFCMKYNPCVKSSICVNLIGNTFDCICSSNDKCFESISDERHSTDSSIDFWESSWIKSKNLLVNIARAFSIEIWFLTRSRDGLLIYAQKTKKGDFLSLNIKNSRLEFIFNLGSKILNVSGVVTIRSDQMITLNQWHKVRINRLDDYATMQINNGIVYSNQAKGNLTELNLDELTYIGGMNDFNESNLDANLTNCLNGAIQKLIINGQRYLASDLLSRRSTETHGISQYLELNDE